MWSVKSTPKPRSLSLGLSFFVAAFVILIASFMSAPSENYRLAVEPEHLAVDVADLAHARVVLHGVDQHGHDVVTVAAGVRELLESPLHARHVAGGLEAPHLVDLLGLHRLVDAQEVDRPPFRHR